jgi:hypothetical protein
MFTDKTRVLLILPAEVLDRARVFAGKATTALKLPVSVQIVLRALIEEGLKRQGAAGIVSNVERQATAIRQIRRSRAQRILGAPGGRTGETGRRRNRRRQTTRHR